MPSVLIATFKPITTQRNASFMCQSKDNLLDLFPAES